MKIDLDELKRQLNIFLESGDGFVTLNDLGLTQADGEQFDKMMMHFLLIVENGLVSNRSLETGFGSVGLASSVMSSGMKWSYAITPLRLTQSGHDFANILNQKPILERLKKEAQEAPFGLLRKLGDALAEKFFKEKLGLGD